MSERDFETRIAEAEAKLQKAIEKAEKEKARLKQLQTKKADAERKERTHLLIVCGAEIAALYGGQHLNIEEIHAVVDYLKQQKESGAFSIRSGENDKIVLALSEGHEKSFEENENIDSAVWEKALSDF